MPLLPGEGAANDTIYANMQYYVGAGWFVGLADLQKVPGTRDHLLGGSDGVHPNPLGHQVYGRLFCRAMRACYGWPDTVAEPCGMWGRRERGRAVRHVGPPGTARTRSPRAPR